MPKKDLQCLTIVGLGLLGGSLAMAMRRFKPTVRVVGFAHRLQTKSRAERMHLADLVTSDLSEAVGQAQLVVLATPICTFPVLMEAMAGALRPGSVVTDVGSTKVQVHAWARRYLPDGVKFVGSHPMAGSERRGLAAARPDLFQGAGCFVTTDHKTDPAALRLVIGLWEGLGCKVTKVSPSRHDRIVAGISHVPQAVAVGLVNATSGRYIPYAGRGFKDTTRIASSDERIWTDIFITNNSNVAAGIGRVIANLESLRRSIARRDRAAIGRLLRAARLKRQPIAGP